jgi:hypothetical protein
MKGKETKPKTKTKLGTILLSLALKQNLNSIYSPNYYS